MVRRRYSAHAFVTNVDKDEDKCTLKKASNFIIVGFWREEGVNFYKHSLNKCPRLAVSHRHSQGSVAIILGLNARGKLLLAVVMVTALTVALLTSFKTADLREMWGLWAFDCLFRKRSVLLKMFHTNIQRHNNFQ